MILETLRISDNIHQINPAAVSPCGVDQAEYFHDAEDRTDVGLPALVHLLDPEPTVLWFILHQRLPCPSNSSTFGY